MIRVQPDEGMTMRFGSKVPGTAMEIRDVNMDFAYGGSFTEASAEAYERLILDVLLGDPPLFPRHEEVELSWKILDPVIEHWAKKGKPDTYASGTWGPAVRRRDARPRRTHLEEALMIELTDTNSAKIAAEFVQARTRAGSPAMGMVMTLVIVADEDDAAEAMLAAKRASREHPARVLGVILGDARGAGQRQRPGRQRRRLGRRDRPDPAQGRGGQARRVRRAAAAPPRLPRRVWWPTARARRPGRRPARRAGPAPDHRLGRGRARQVAPAMLHQCRAYAPGNTDLAGPGSRRGGRCSRRRSTSTR